ncbi:MAG TPA: hypothetical protein VKR22_03890 [Acidimicrobiales bacterium]|nr:hypothetical protein [Acidimicrobiales bacterium]
MSTLVAVASTAGPASATPLVNCNVTATVNFALNGPGLSANGFTSANKTGGTGISGTALSGGGSCGSASVTVPGIITTKGTKCKGPGSPSAGCSVKGTFLYDNWGGFTSLATLKSVTKSLKSVSVTYAGVTYVLKTTSTAPSGCSSGTYGNELGFQINGTVKAPKADKGMTSTLIACLGADSGSGASGNFNTDSSNQAGPVATATIDGATSSITIGS